MKLCRILPVVLCALLLSGCAERVSKPQSTCEPAPPDIQAVSPSGGEPESGAADAPGTETSAEASSGGADGLTEEEIRALYDDSVMTIYSITPYNGDYLVRYSPSPESGPWLFDWVYGINGARVKLLFSNDGIRECEIRAAGSIRVVTDGHHSEWAYRSFPQIKYAAAAVSLDADGLPITSDDYRDFSTTETYWADISESISMGMEGRREVVTDAFVGVSGVEVAFGPPADTEGFGAFYAACCTPPAVDISSEADSRIMTVVFRDTSLSSGDMPDFDEDYKRESYQQYLEATGVTFPTSFPAGALEGSNPLIEKASIEEQGSDTFLTLHLTEEAVVYTVESGRTGPADRGPYLRFILRAGSDW